MNEKIKTFASLPQSELTNLNDEETNENSFTKLRNVEKEFEQTNTHTKQTQQEQLNTDSIDNIDNIDTETIDEGVTDAKKNRLGKLISGNFAVDLMDMLIPTLVIVVINFVGYSIEKKELQLTKSEKESIAPAIEDVLNEIKIDFSNPYTNLIVILSIVYGTKIIDKVPTMKKKIKKQPEIKKGMTEAINEIVSGTDDIIEVESPMGKFQIDYGKLIDEVRLSRKRGVKDAKQYVAENYNEKIKAIAKKHGVPLSHIDEELNFVHIPKKREKPIDFNLE